MCIAARVCAPQPQILYIINPLIVKNDSNAVLITMMLSWVNILPTNSLSSSLCTAKTKKGKGGVR